MTGRIVRPDRHFVVLFCLSVAVGGFTLLQRDQIWLSERLWASDWANLSVFLLGPIAVGVGDFDARDFRLGGLAELAAASARPRMAMMRAVLRTYVPLAVGHASVLGGTVGIASLRHGAAPRLADTTSALALLLCYCAAGWLIGQRLSGIVVAPILVLVAFGAQLLAFRQGLKPVLQVGGATSSLVGLQTDVTHVIVQTTALVALSALLIMRLAARVDGQRRLRLLGFLLALSLSVSAFASGHLILSGSTRFELATTPGLICDGRDGSYVCVERDYAGQLDAAVELAQQVNQRLLGAGVAPPTRYEQGLIGRTQTMPPGKSNLSTADSTFDGMDFVREVVYTYILKCPDLRSAARDEGFATPAAILQWWLLVDIDAAVARDTEDLIPPQFRALPPEQQMTWVTEAAFAMSECRPPGPV